MDINKLRLAVIKAIDSLCDEDIEKNMITIGVEYKTYGSSNVIRITFHHNHPNVSVTYEHYDDGRPPRKCMIDENDKIASGDISIDQMIYEIYAEFLMRGVEFDYGKKAV